MLQAFKRAVSTLVVEEAPSNRRQADRFDACGQRRTHQPPSSGPFRRLWSKTHPPTAAKRTVSTLVVKDAPTNRRQAA